MAKIGVFIILVLGSLVAAATTEGVPSLEQGTIRGTVVGEQGAPAKNFEVRADLRNVVSLGAAVISVETDDRGQFVFEHLRFGIYGVFVMNEDAGYPNTAFAFYSNNEFTSVTLTPQMSAASVNIRLGPKAALITGVVRDSISGKPIDATFRLTRAKPPGLFFATSAPAQYRILIPASTDVFVEVLAKGYKTWRYQQPGDAARHILNLPSGAESTIDVQLQPDASEPPDNENAATSLKKWCIVPSLSGTMLQNNLPSLDTTTCAPMLQLHEFPSSGIVGLG